MLCNRTAVIKLNSQVARKGARQLSRLTGKQSPGGLTDGEAEKEAGIGGKRNRLEDKWKVGGDSANTKRQQLIYSS